MDVLYHEKQLKDFELLKNDNHHAVRIAVCGKFKSGKTSLLNLLLDTQLPVQAVTATGTITKIIYGKSYAIKKNDGLICDLSKDQLNNLITVQNKTLDGIEISDIQTAYIGSHSKLLKRGKIEFWDTPGFEDDPTLTKITLNAIKQCDLVICVMHANQLLSLFEKRLFPKLFKQMNGNIIFVINHMDSIHDYEKINVCNTANNALKQYNNQYFKNGNIFYTSANPDAPDIEQLKQALKNTIYDNRLDILKTTKIGKANVLSEEWKEQIHDEQKITDNNIKEVEIQINENIKTKQNIIDKQYKNIIYDIKQFHTNIQSKLSNEILWKQVFTDYQSKPNWECDFKNEASEFIKRYILDILADFNKSMYEIVKVCDFLNTKDLNYIFNVDNKIWQKKYVYQKNFVKPILFPQKRFKQYCIDCVEQSVNLLMSNITNDLQKNLDTFINTLLNNIELQYKNARQNIKAEQELINFFELSQTNSTKLKYYNSKISEIYNYIYADSIRKSFFYKFIDFVSIIFPKMLSNEIF